MKNKIIQIVVALSFIVMIMVNSLANILPINGINTGQVSDSYPNLFAPAGVTFSIWGIIYLYLAVYTLFQFGIFQKDKVKSRLKLFQTIGKYFIATSIANSLWIFTWHYDFIGHSVLLIITILFFLIKIINTLKREKLSTLEKWLIHTPFSIYFGWITIATIANISTYLVSLGWDGSGIAPQLWTIIILLVGASVGLLGILKEKNIAYGLVFIWAYYGIWIKHTSLSGYASQYPSIITTLLICLGLFFIAQGLVLYRPKNK